MESLRKIGFDYQRGNEGNCAQRSLMHALLLLGMPISEDEAHRLTDRPRWKTRLWGTNEHHLKLAIRKTGFKPISRLMYDRAEAHRHIDDMLDAGYPVIICTEDNQHWAVLAGRANASQYYWIDSADDDLYGVWNWTDIADWMEWRGEYYYIGVAPKTKSDKRTSAVTDFFRMYHEFDDDDLAEYWGWYLQDLRACFDLPEHTSGAVNAREFFDEHGRMIFESCRNACRDIDENQLRYEYGNYRKVALVHNMSVSKDRLPEAIARLSAAVTYSSSI